MEVEDPDDEPAAPEEELAGDEELADDEPSPETLGELAEVCPEDEAVCCAALPWLLFPESSRLA